MKKLNSLQLLKLEKYLYKSIILYKNNRVSKKYNLYKFPPKMKEFFEKYYSNIIVTDSKVMESTYKGITSVKL